MTARFYTVTVREAPKSVNSGGGGARTHHMKAHREKRYFEGLYLMEFLAARLQKGMTHCAVDITVRWRRYNHQEKENYRHPVVKPLADALVKGGYITDDSDDIFEVRSFEFAFGELEWPRVKAVVDITLEGHYA